MAIPASAQWRVRGGGSNVNGGGFDATVTGVPSTTLNGAISAAATVVVVASFAGWPAAGSYYARIGNVGPEVFSSGAVGSSEIVLVTGGQGTTSWTVTRAQLGTSAQAFATGVVVDNELSRCNTAIASGTVGTSTASTTFTSVGATFDSTYIGNVLWIASGTGATVGAYFIQSVTNATTVVLDRVSGTYTVAVWKVGGAWADPKTNCESTSQIVAGNVIYVRAGGSGTWAGGVGTTDYTLAGYMLMLPGDATNGYIKIIGENGRPYVRSATGNSLGFYTSVGTGYQWVENLYLIANGITSGSDYGIISTLGMTYNVVCDQNGFDVRGITSPGSVINCEVYSSTANGGAAGANYAILSAPNGGALYTQTVVSCNVHDCWGNGIDINHMGRVMGCVVAKNKGNSINFPVGEATFAYVRALLGCTIDGGLGHGIVISDAVILAQATIVGNIISNHNQAGKYGIQCNFGTTAANDRLRGLIDNNTFFNNTANALNLTVSSANLNGHVYANNIGVDPGFTGQSTQNYAIGTALQNLGFPQAAFVQSKSGQTTGVRNYMDPGAVQPVPSAGGGTTIINSRATAHARR